MGSTRAGTSFLNRPTLTDTRRPDGRTDRNSVAFIRERSALLHAGTSSSAMAERPRELDQRFQMGGQFEAIID